MQKVNLRGKTITIVGPATFETFLKAHYLTQMTGVSFRFFHEEPSGHPSGENGLNSSTIVLVDCEKGNVESCLSGMKADSQLNGIFQKPMVLFNVAPEDVEKQEEVNAGVRGLLSFGVSPDVFLETVVGAICGEKAPPSGCGAVKLT